LGLEIFAYLLAQGYDPVEVLSKKMPLPTDILPRIGQPKAPLLRDYETEFEREHGAGKKPNYTRTLIKIKKVLEDDKDLVAAIAPEEALEALAKRTDQIHGIACSFHCVGSTPCLSDPIALQLYRIAQESVCNALKHSGASRILIAIEATQGCTKLQVADNGNGFHHQQTHSGLGLQSMQYRAELIGAKIQIRTSICGGTVVCCALDGAKDA
jgi:hypothetical protein